MKRKFVYVVSIAVVAVMAFINVNVSERDNICGGFLSFEDIEALADNEWNNWEQWFSQGLTKDEREETRPCPSIESGSGSVNGSYGGGSIGGSGSHSQVNPSGRYEIICPYGESNCTNVGC